LVGIDGEIYFESDELFNMDNALFNVSKKEVYYFLKLIIFEVLEKALNFRVVPYGKKVKKGHYRMDHEESILARLGLKPANNQGTPLIRTQELRSLLEEAKHDSEFQ
jgi:hypothetical protein